MSGFLKAVIIVSVLLNLLFAGIVIGHLGRYFIAQNKKLTLQEVATALPENKRDAFKDMIAHTDSDLAGLRQQLADARKRAAGVLKAEPFDKKAYLVQMQLIYQLKVQIAQHIAEGVAGLATEANPAERAAIADIAFH